MGKLALHVVCKNCGREFDTRLRLDRRSFERGTLAANYHMCPHCGEKLTYRKVDYVVKER
jgi:DNA-directed RNA polymerase subunit RPC12/RpoP